jgi:hypothetical protein
VKLRLTLSVLLVVAAAWAAADTLVLRNGRRIEGQLVGMRGDTIEFEEWRGSSSRTQRYDRRDVSRIEFDDSSASGGMGSGIGSSGSSIGGQRPSGLRERAVQVNAETDWNDTGIDVRRNQEIYFEASGRVRWGPDRRHGPGGEGGSHTNPNRPMPNRPGGSLIGRIGTGSDYFFIGDDRAPIRVRDGGRLYLGVNDDYLQDNSGYFTVTVYH